MFQLLENGQVSQLHEHNPLLIDLSKQIYSHQKIRIKNTDNHMYTGNILNFLPNSFLLYPSYYFLYKCSDPFFCWTTKQKNQNPPFGRVGDYFFAKMSSLYKIALLFILYSKHGYPYLCYFYYSLIGAPHFRMKRARRWCCIDCQKVLNFSSYYRINHSCGWNEHARAHCFYSCEYLW